MTKLTKDMAYKIGYKMCGCGVGSDIYPIKFDGHTYYTIQDAYVSGTTEHPYYTASVIMVGDEIDEYDNVPIYEMIWEIEDWDRYYDGDEDCCDWDNPDNVDWRHSTLDVETLRVF